MAFVAGHESRDGSGSLVRLSRTAMASTHGEDSPYFAGLNEYTKNPYDPVTNPSGIIQMGLAENQVTLDLLHEWLLEHPEISRCLLQEEGNTTFKETALFQDYHGLQTFREAVAKFMSLVRGGDVKFDANRIVLTAGATAANELVTFCLADPGDALLVPTPFYPGFDRDLRWRTGVNIVHVPCHSSNNFELTIAALNQAYNDALNSNITINAILVTNPSNPLGTTLSMKTLSDLLKFAAEKDIHLICDEIFSGSVFQQPALVSISHVLKLEEFSGASKKNYLDRVHMVYSLSKDLGLPGFRVGVLYSYNDTVVRVARSMSSFSMVSSQTQHFLACILSDETFIRKYMETSRARLRVRQGILVRGLGRAGISCLHGNSGLFCWANLTHLLPQNKSVQAELHLWNIILHDIGVNVSPGSAFHCQEPGWFRVCFANMNESTLKISMKRIQAFASAKQDSSPPPSSPSSSSSSFSSSSSCSSSSSSSSSSEEDNTTSSLNQSLSCGNFGYVHSTM